VFVCALVYGRTHNLGVCIAGHMLTNLVMGLFEIAMLG
jgi:membrane protease YdiL (CAAX protease family)